MNFKFVNTIFALGLLLIMSNSTVKSKDYKLEFLDFNPIDLCGKEFQKEVIIAPTLGMVIKPDSLIGFEISVGYDPDVVRMNKVLYINTFADRFKFKKSFNDSETGEIVFEGAVGLQGFPNPLSGDLPLVGFAGDFIGDCNDSAKFTVNYFYPFDDFKGSVDSDTSITIAGRIVDTPTRKIGFEFENSNLKIKKDSSASLSIDLDLGELSSLDYWQAKVTLDTDSISITKITGSNTVDISNETLVGDNGYLFDMSVTNSEDAKIELELSSSKFDSADVKVMIETVETTECICATNFPSSESTVNNLQSDSVTTNVEYTDSYEYLNGIIIPRSEAYVEVYDLIGNTVDRQVCNINNVYDSNKLKQGIYFIKVTTKEVTRIYKKINN